MANGQQPKRKPIRAQGLLDGRQPQKRKPGTLDRFQMDTGTMNKSQIRGYKKNMPNLIDDDVIRGKKLPKAQLPMRRRKKLDPKRVA